jgi:glycerol-3-phosphate dehydrogenase (NAD(P)+)
LQNKKNILLIGNGSWATAIAKLLTDNLQISDKINWYFRHKEDAEFLKENKRNRHYLTTIKFETNKLNIFTDLNDALSLSDIVFIAIPSAFLQNELEKININISDKFIISGIKGIVPDKHLIISKYFNQNFDIPFKSFAILSGPCHAEEIAMERLSYLTIASQDLYNAAFIAELLNTSYLKTSLSNDVFGKEYAAVLKNIFALASGICQGLGYGDNFQAVLISNAIQEINRFVNTLHPTDRDIKNTAYLGDLLVTAYSNFSRNRTFGQMIGKGYSASTTQLEMNMIAEGYYATKSIFEINKKYNIYMPILDAVYNILYNNQPPAFEIKLLTDKLR